MSIGLLSYWFRPTILNVEPVDGSPANNHTTDAAVAATLPPPPPPPPPPSPPADALSNTIHYHPHTPCSCETDQTHTTDESDCSSSPKKTAGPARECCPACYSLQHPSHQDHSAQLNSQQQSKQPHHATQQDQEQQHHYLPDALHMQYLHGPLPEEHPALDTSFNNNNESRANNSLHPQFSTPRCQRDDRQTSDHLQQQQRHAPTDGQQFFLQVQHTPDPSALLRLRIHELYADFVTPFGVRYVDLLQSHRFADFKRAVSYLPHYHPLEHLPSNEQRIAFFANLYNALTIHAFAELGPPADNGLARIIFNAQACYNVGGHVLSLADIENGILRRNRGVSIWPRPFGRRGADLRLELMVHRLDPRIHFVLNCGAISCPPIRFLTADRLDEQLAIAARSFFRDRSNFDIETLSVDNLRSASPSTTPQESNLVRMHEKNEAERGSSALENDTGAGTSQSAESGLGDEGHDVPSTLRSSLAWLSSLALLSTSHRAVSVVLSPILQWYRTDFAADGSDDGLLRFVLECAEPDDIRVKTLRELLEHDPSASRITVKFAPYDWSLNAYQAVSVPAAED